MAVKTLQTIGAAAERIIIKFVGRSPFRPNLMPEQRRTTTKQHAEKVNAEQQQSSLYNEVSEELLLVFVHEAVQASGLTQKEMAIELGISQPSVNLAVGGSSNHRKIMIRILNRWHPTLEVEPSPILRYRIKPKNKSSE